MTDKPKFESWQAILDSNTSGMPPIIGGMPRGGTTHAYRSMWAAQVNPQPYFLEEYMHPYYQYHFRDEEPRIVLDIAGMDAAQAEGKIINQEGHPDVEGRELELRYQKLLASPRGHAGGFMKVFPIHALKLKRYNEEFYMHMIENHHWFLIMREQFHDWLFSNAYSNRFNKFHYYENQKLIDIEFEGHVQSIDFHVNMLNEIYDQRRLMKSYSVVWTSQFSHLKSPFSLWLQRKISTPRLDKDKPALLKKIMTNYNELYEHAIKQFNATVPEHTNGWLTLDSDNQLVIDETAK